MRSITSRNNRKMHKKKNKKADVWISTVLYTLIGLAVMAILLSVIRPELARMKDSYTLDQTKITLSQLDKIINEITRATGNAKGFTLYMSRGTLTINTMDNKIEWLIENSNYQLSEPGVELLSPGTNIKTTTTKKGDVYDILLVLDYSEKKFNLTLDGIDAEPKVIQPAKAAYSIMLENKGYLPGRQTKQVDISIT